MRDGGRVEEGGEEGKREKEDIGKGKKRELVRGRRRGKEKEGYLFA